jgi:hypothetical protein
MSQSKKEFCLERIIELIDKVVARESIPKDGESYADLGFVKFYAKDLATECKDCAKSHDETDKKHN